jgi:excisionase family DNA binding protein
MTCRTKPRHAADRADKTGTTAAPICRRLFTIEQAADVRGVPAHEIRQLIMNRALPAYRLAGGIRIDEVELAELLSTRQSNQP